MWGNKVGFHNIVQFGFLIGFLVKANPKKWELYLICEKFKKYSPNGTGENLSAICVILVIV